MKNCAAKNTRCAGMLATVGSVALLFFSSMLALYLLADCFQLFPRVKAVDMGFHAAFGGTIIGLVAEIIRYHRVTTRN
ncbi:MAG: hypothetical protein PHO48_01830 [Candidatus Gracilibacteria bacterium]|nr:hypothetical protein [Candidatus Gracilibacteria bacterium]MDD5178833.1 hypothetical protein [Candidatus Gracilibacteria bacterium]